MAEWKGETSNSVSEAKRSPGLRPAPAEGVAQQLSVSEKVAETEGFEPSIRP